MTEFEAVISTQAEKKLLPSYLNILKFA